MTASLLMDLHERDKDKLLMHFNTMPCFAGSGGHIVSISDNLMTVEVHVPLSDQTRNIVGTIYGGSMYAASDAIYMVLLWFQLGAEYLLADKSSQVEYLRPARSDVYAKFSITGSVIDEIRLELNEKKSCLKSFPIEFAEASGKLACRIEKTVYIRKAPVRDALTA